MRCPPARATSLHASQGSALTLLYRVGGWARRMPAVPHAGHRPPAPGDGGLVRLLPAPPPGEGELVACGA